MQFEKINWFRTICNENGFIVTDIQLEQLDYYVKLLLDWNKKINLISRKDEENFWSYHILHSVAPLFKLKITESCKIVDIGTGGGLPGIPIKILRPDIFLLCLDATRKKANAVLQMVKELKLKNVDVLWGRAEEIGIQSEYLHKFDFVMARAVCQLNELIFLSGNFLKMQNLYSPNEKIIYDGIIDPKPPALIAFKGGNLTKEINLVKREYPQAIIDEINLTFKGSRKIYCI